MLQCDDRELAPDGRRRITRVACGLEARDRRHWWTVSSGIRSRAGCSARRSSVLALGDRHRHDLSSRCNPAKPGYVVEGVEEVASAGPAAVADKPVAFYLASADHGQGRGDIQEMPVRATTPSRAARPAIGPNLWGVTRRPARAHARLRLFRRYVRDQGQDLGFRRRLTRG